MSDLTSIFDIVRGWPNGSAVEWVFLQDSGAASDIDEGTVVAVVASSDPVSVDRHTSALIGPSVDQPDHPWMVIRGKESWDADFTGKLTCLKMRTGFVVKLPTILSPAPSPGDLLWADANGVLTTTDPAGGELHVGKVTEYNSSGGWMIVES
jgi:hypothetical protein